MLLTGFACLALVAGSTARAGDVPAATDEATPRAVWTTTIEAGQPPALGYRYGRLSRSQSAALRRRFKLPMAALTARTPEQLAAAAELAPLPDPHRPMLPMAADAGDPARAGATPAVDPFGADPTAAVTRAEFRADPMMAFAKLLGVDPSAAAPAVDTSGFAAADPFGDESTVDAADDAAVGDDLDNADPFADDAGDDFDPFGDF